MSERPIKKKIVINEFNKFNYTKLPVDFGHHLNQYKHDALNVYSYDEELEKFLKENEIDYVVKERKPFLGFSYIKQRYEL